MRMLFSIGAVLVAGVLAGGDVAGIAAPGPKFEPSKSSPQRLAADRDAQTVDVELVLAVDVSYSMDMDELAIQREGYAQAIQSKEFLQALKLGPNGRIAVTYFEWAASSDQNAAASSDKPAATETAQNKLPQTGSPLPFISLLGMGSLAAGLVNRLRK